VFRVFRGLPKAPRGWCCFLFFASLRFLPFGLIPAPALPRCVSCVRSWPSSQLPLGYQIPPVIRVIRAIRGQSPFAPCLPYLNPPTEASSEGGAKVGPRIPRFPLLSFAPIPEIRD
jgi:hypothetical protein